ncbi:MAG TPA: hypothetical protein VFK80_05320, partial [Limnochordia bacterium]|nr:hypothetical protein [Limnochordia bacterium]
MRKASSSVRRWPYVLRYALTFAWSHVAFRAARAERRALLDVLARSLPPTNARQIRRIARRHWVHRALTALEWVHADVRAPNRKSALD